MPVVRAINDAMADLEQLYPDAIPTALREETITRYGEGLSIEQALRRQRGSHAQAVSAPATC